MAQRRSRSQLDVRPTTRPVCWTWLLRLRAEVVTLCPQRGLGPIGDADLSENAREVRLDGLLADLELACDQLVGKSLGHEPQDFLLARAEPGRSSADVRTVREHLAG